MGDVLRNRQQAAQLKVFEGMRWGSISPTDIDAFLEFKNRLFVFIETKHGGTLPEGGQRWGLERLCDACDRDGRLSVVLVASHESDGDIVFRDLPVTFYRYKGQWLRPKQRLTLYEAVTLFHDIAFAKRRDKA